MTVLQRIVIGQRGIAHVFITCKARVDNVNEFKVEAYLNGLV